MGFGQFALDSALILNVIIALGACRAEQSAARDETRTTPPRGPGMIAAPSDSLSFQLEVPAEVPAGAPVPIALRATNTRSTPIELHLLGRTPTFDITVTRPDGTVVWRRLEGATIPSILRLVVLPPGESLTLEERWDQRSNGGVSVPPGRYTVVGALLTDERQPLRTPAVQLRIMAR